MRPGRILAAALCAAALEAPAAAAPARRVLVLGVDGLDPVLLRSYLDRGLLPNVARLIEQGDFKPLGTSMPPLSPVAWSNFVTGMDPGGHGVFDFIHRDAKTMAPTRAESGTEPPRTLALGDCRVLPIGGGGPVNLRHGRAFWELLEAGGVPTVVYKIPANFPPAEGRGKSLSGMGTPDIAGTPGWFSFYTDRHVPNAAEVTGGEVFPVRVENGQVAATLFGPPNPFFDSAKPGCYGRPRTERKLTVDFTVWLDSELPAAKLDVQGTEFVLREGEWSDWVRVDFEALPLVASVSSIGRFFLKQVRPQFELYVTPLQIDPAEPGGMRLSTPEDWSHELCEDLGYFYTQELAEDTKALTYGVLSPREFWQQTQFVYQEQRRAFEYLLERWNEGLLFFYVSSVDQNSHMLWNYMDAEHPGHLEDPLLAAGVESLYRAVDEMIGRAQAVADENTTLVVMSDHGFAPFYWQVQLNTWLAQKGYVTLLPPDPRRPSLWYGDVDWSRTQAYALGLNGVYVNLRGREKRGIVNDGADRDRLVARLEQDLLEMVDPRNGLRPVSLVVNTRRDFRGPHAGDGPELIVGYSRGYRSSWSSPLGEFKEPVFSDNDEPWSGDHAMDHRQVPGVLIANRPITLEAPALTDLTVAILDEYGVPKPPEMIGSDCLGAR